MSEPPRFGALTLPNEPWSDPSSRDFTSYDPPYARGGERIAEPAVIDELLGSTIPDLRPLA